MCSHILSDIEVLCDNVAILKQGRLAHAGSLDELRARESSGFEIIVTNTGPGLFMLWLPEASLAQTANGLRIEVHDEREIDRVMETLRDSNGKLVSINPIKQSLEDLF